MSVLISNSKQTGSFRSLRKKFVAGATASVLALGALVGFAGPAAANGSSPVASVGEQSIAQGTSALNALSTENGIIYLVPANYDLAGKTMGDLDDLVTAGTATFVNVFANVATTIPTTGPTQGSFLAVGTYKVVAGNLAAVLSAASVETVTITLAAPTVSTPTISGTAKVGVELTGSATVAGGASTTTYAWEISDNGTTGWTAIAGATTTTYTPVAGDETKFIKFVVTATNATETVTEESLSTLAVAAADVVGVAPAIATATITGTPTVGQVLTAGSTGVTGTPTPTRTYQWKAGGVDISGATGQTFTLTSAQLGAVITVLVTATNGTDPAASATSTGTTAVAAAPVVSSPAPSAGGGTIIESPRPAPVATPVSTPVQKPTSAFAANSSKLSKDLRASIRATLDSKLDAKSATCRAFVGSSNATAGERKLARDRSTAVCNFITNSYPNLDVQVVKTNLVAKSANQLRKVRLVLR